MNKKWIVIIGVSILVISCVIVGASFAEFNDSDVFNGSIKIGT